MASSNPFKGYHFDKSLILQAVYWYCRYSLSYRDIEELMKERGVEVDHATIQRWVEAFIPLIEEQVKRRKKRVNGSWRMDETYINVKGKWCYLYRAIDKEGNTIDFLLCQKRDTEGATQFFNKAIAANGVPLKINIDKSGANTAALANINEEREKAKQPLIEVRRIKYLNNQVEQDHRFIKRLTRPMLGFKSFISASITLAGIEIVRMIKKGQLKSSILGPMPLEQFKELFV